MQLSVRPTKVANAAEAAIVKGMILRGDPIHDVAAWFGINSARIANVKNAKEEGAKYRDVLPAPAHTLPPAGPYPRLGDTMVALAQLREELKLTADERRQTIEELKRAADERKVGAHERRQTNEKLNQLQRQIAAFGRELKLIENPKAPQISRGMPLES